MADLNINLVVAAKDAASKALGDINKSLGKIGDAAKSVGAKIVDFGKIVATAALVGAAAIGALIVGKAIPAAADLAEQLSKNTVVFGDAAQAVIDFSKTTASSLGISQAAALTATGTFGNLFRAIGITEKPAADMSVAMVQLASDMASFNNASPEEVLEALRAGLVGETEPLRRFGINLNDAALRQKALELGLTTTTKDVLPPAIKAQAAYALIMEQSSLAQGDFARTSDSVANQQRIFAATVEDSMAKIGAAFLPLAAEVLPILTTAITTVADTLTKDVIPAVQKWFSENEPLIRQVFDFVGNVLSKLGDILFNQVVPAISAIVGAVADWFEENRPLFEQIGKFALEAIPQIVDAIVGAFTFIWDTVSPIIDAIGEVFSALGELFTEVTGTMGEDSIDFGAIVGAVFEAVGTIITTVAGVIKTVLLGVAGFIRDNKETIAAVINGLVQAFKIAFGVISTVIGAVFGIGGKIAGFIGNAIKFFNDLVTFITGLPGKIANAARGMFDGIWQAFKAAMNTVIRFWNNLGFTIGPIDLGPIGKFGPWHIGTPNLPFLAQGGVLPPGGVGIVGEAGPELLVAGSTGATVIPLNGQAGGLTVNFNSVWPPTLQQAREIAAAVDRVLYYQRSGASRRPR